MSLLTDRFGNTVSTRNRKALDLYDWAVSQLNTYRIDPIATIDAALAEDPAFVMAHCFKAGLLLTSTERAAESAIAASLGAAELHLAHATDRERAHTAAARAWLAGDFAESMRLYGEIAADYPRDLFALQVAHLCDFFLGQSNMLRDRPTQALSAWSSRESGYGFVLGMRAFGLEECGAYADAERVGKQAVEINAADAWAAHAVAHVYEMQGRTGAGMNWLEGTASGWSQDCFFASHNWWHLALMHLEREDYAGALALYDTVVRPVDNQVALEMVDASALLWRLHLRGADVGDRWQHLANAWERFGESGYYAFNDVHALMAFLCTGRGDAAERMLRGLEAAAQSITTNGMMSREVGLPLAHALTAFERGDYAMAIEDLTRVRGIAQRFGGSHAQRDLIQLTLCEAAFRVGRRSLVQGLVAERLSLKPESPFNRRLLARATSQAEKAAAA
jgi:tetratricopeptide (TPR) repeat protein